MARDRSLLSQRLKSLAQRAGRTGQEEGHPPATASAPITRADEQPTGEIPVAAEQPTDEQPAVTLPPEPAQPIVAPIEPPAAQPTLMTDPLPAAQSDGPTLTPPVLPSRETPAPAQPTAEPAPSAAEGDSGEPFSGATVWPQSSPTPRFAPQEPEPQPAAPTFPEPSPEPAGNDPTATEPVTPEEPAAPAGARATNASPSAVEVPAEPAAEPDPTAGAALADGAAKPKRTGGLLGRLRPGRREGSTEDVSGAAAPAGEPVAPDAAGPTPATPDPRPAILPPSPEPPEKPSFGERASLRRRAKSLRARRDSGLLELGAIVLDQRRFGDPTGGSLMRRRTDELADIDSELAAIEQVLDDDGPAETVAQLGVVRCLTCTALVGPRDRFCVQCGAPRPADAAPGRA